MTRTVLLRFCAADRRILCGPQWTVYELGLYFVLYMWCCARLRPAEIWRRIQIVCIIKDAVSRQGALDDGDGIRFILYIYNDKVYSIIYNVT